MPRFERPAAPEKTLPNKFVIHAMPAYFLEVERVDNVLWSCAGTLGDVPRIKKKRFHSEDDAQHATGRLIRRYRNRGYLEVGACTVLPGFTAQRPPGSVLLIQEYFEQADPRLLDELLHFHSLTQLAALAERWYQDKRPAMRAALLAYIDDGCARREHKALVKRLFKLAEAAQDDEAMLHFMVAFDRLSRRTLGVVGSQWDMATGRYTAEIGLRADYAELGRLWRTDNKVAQVPHFTRVTRLYLRRRVFRYFRRIGRRDPERYVQAMCKALPRYRDEHLNSPAKLLDAWSLMHVLYGYSDVLTKRPRGLVLRPGRALAELAPAPYFASAWEDRFEALIQLLTQAESRTVRQWSLRMLQTKYAEKMASLPWDTIHTLLRSAHADLATLGAELLNDHPAARSLPLDIWLGLLIQKNLDVLAVVCAEMQKSVTPERLNLAQCVELACAPAASVASMGFAWVKGKPADHEEALSTLVKLRTALVPNVRAEAATWLRELLATHRAASGNHVRDLCDAQFADVRDAGLKLMTTYERFRSDAALWFALVESPYDDVRSVVLKHTHVWHEKAAPHTLQHLWTSAILAVHRGGVSKRRVPLLIAQRLARHPEEAGSLLPILGLALRSVRAPERTSALGALARAVATNANLKGPLSTLLPEVSFTNEVSS